jgi:hypothetical protein
MLLYALTHYHSTLKVVLEKALATPDLLQKITTLDKKGKSRANRYALSKFLYTIAPKGWALAPLRDYLIGDAQAMLLSNFKKLEKGKHKSNPPTVPTLEPLTEPEAQQAYDEFVNTGNRRPQRTGVCASQPFPPSCGGKGVREKVSGTFSSILRVLETAWEGEKRYLEPFPLEPFPARDIRLPNNVTKSIIHARRTLSPCIAAAPPLNSASSLIYAARVVTI